MVGERNKAEEYRLDNEGLAHVCFLGCTAALGDKIMAITGLGRILLITYSSLNKCCACFGSAYVAENFTSIHITLLSQLGLDESSGDGPYGTPIEMNWKPIDIMPKLKDVVTQGQSRWASIRQVS